MVVSLTSTSEPCLSARGLEGVAWLQHEPAPPKGILRQRSRGRHDPGSGNYLNRIAIGGYTAYEVGGRRFALDIQAIDDYDAPTIYQEPGYNITYWDQKVLIQGTAGNRRSGSSRNRWCFSGRIWYNAYRYVNRKVIFLRGSGSVLNLYATDFGFPNTRQGAYDFVSAIIADPSRFVAPYSDYGASNTVVSGGTYVTTMPKLDVRYKHFSDAIDLGSPRTLGVQSGFAAAYIDAVNKLPTAYGMGNAVNIIQLASSLFTLIAGVISGAGVRLDKVGTIRDAWLGYRYTYSTTKADLLEIRDLALRIANLKSDSVIRSSGMATRGSVTYRCSIKVCYGDFTSIQSRCEKIGLQLDAYALWDLVPFSFVVDWFIDIGGWLELGRSSGLARRLGSHEAWFSMRDSFTNSYGFRELFYYRYRGLANLNLSAFAYSAYDPSGVTIVKRGLDLIALLGKGG